MLISNLEQFEALPNENFVRGGLVLLSKPGNIQLKSNTGKNLVDKKLAEGQPTTSPFSDPEEGVTGILATIWGEDEDFTYQAVALSGVTAMGGSFAFSSSTISIV